MLPLHHSPTAYKLEGPFRSVKAFPAYSALTSANGAVQSTVLQIQLEGDTATLHNGDRFEPSPVAARSPSEWKWVWSYQGTGLPADPGSFG